MVVSEKEEGGMLKGIITQLSRPTFNSSPYLRIKLYHVRMMNLYGQHFEEFMQINNNMERKSI